MKQVGYLVNTAKGPEGETGLFYDYILAGNGLFIRAKNELIGATVLVAGAKVRGLEPLEQKAELLKGKIPRRLYDFALSCLSADCHRERFVGITWDGEYRLSIPIQDGREGGVTYNRVQATVMDMHSHGTGHAFFSRVDDNDEQGLRLSLVLGRLDTLVPEGMLRIGVYGYFAKVKLEEVIG